MAQEFGFRFTATGPAEERDRLKEVIESHAQRQSNGEYLVIVGDLFGLPDACEAFWLVPTWYGRFDNVPVRTWNGTFEHMPVRQCVALAMKGYCRHRPPYTFLEEASRQYPQLDCHLQCDGLSDSTYEHLHAKAGEVERLEFQAFSDYTAEINEWEKADLVWVWEGKRQQDLAMLCRFLRIEASEGTTEDELADSCERAYDALAFPGVVCPSRVNGHVYSLAKELLEHRAEVKKYAYLDGLNTT
jgi:hypothetical protein